MKSFQTVRHVQRMTGAHQSHSVVVSEQEGKDMTSLEWLSNIVGTQEIVKEGRRSLPWNELGCKEDICLKEQLVCI